MKLLPTRRLAWLSAAVTLLLWPSLAQPEWAWWGLVGDLLLLAWAVLDAVRLAPPTLLTARRELPANLAVGETATARLVVHNRSRQTVELTLREAPPAELGALTDPPPLRLAPDASGSVTWQLRPTVRGSHPLTVLTLRYASPSGLWERQEVRRCEQPVRVYPHPRAWRGGDLLRQASRRLESGLRTARLRGAGTEFESLREYQADDEYRRIDWRATARRGRLVTRQYEVERSQTVQLCLDVGRLMTCRLDQRTRLDHAIDAALLLAGIATQLHDRVGLLVFAAQPLTYLPPGRGRPQVRRILEALYDLPGELVEPDYAAALRLLGLRQRKRSLVVLLTDWIDPAASAGLLQAAASLRPAHLPLLASFRDPTVSALHTAAPLNAPAVYERALAHQTLQARDAAVSALRAAGLRVVDAPPERAGAAMVQAYLDLKAQLLL
ncbi:MAG: DUF58 domain-containing protein [Fimbriimonadaceae bacterium]|nr:DUF58 domain-containing protein [Fimbriimonadaceae bacterium]